MMIIFDNAATIDNRAESKTINQNNLDSNTESHTEKNTQSNVIDSSTMQRISGQLGSNPAGIFTAQDGQRYYIKTLESLAHVRNEFIAAKLYQLAGVPTLNYHLCNEPDQLATQWIDLDKRYIAHLDAHELQQAQQWFGVHAWLANWDVAGADGDNQGTLNNRVLTLDAGGALNFRAMGDPKGKLFGSQVGELDTLRKDINNPHALTLFAAMSDEQIKQAIKVVTDLPDDQIRDVILSHHGHPKLVAKMLARKAYMAEQLLSVCKR